MLTKIFTQRRLIIILYGVLCCLFTACTDNKASNHSTNITKEFQDFITKYKTDDSNNKSESRDGYQVALLNGRLSIANSENIEIWQSNEEWYVDSFQLEDINRDQILDVAFIVWKSYRFGSEHPARMTNKDAAVRCHLFVYSVKDDRVKSLWCSSSLPRPIYTFEFNTNAKQSPTLSGVQLVTQEGAYTEDYSKTASSEYIYEWNSWGFSPLTSQYDIKPTTQYATLAVVGDLMCHEAQNQDALAKGNDVEYNFNYAFKHIAPYISAADYAIGNLETTIQLNGNRPSDFPLFGAPPSFAEAIKNAGFDLVTTANNHALDFGKEGLVHTIEVLDEIGLAHTGTYTNEKDSKKIKVIDVNGITFAILSYTYSTNGNTLPQNELWSVNKTDTIIHNIAQAKALNPDVIIVMPHMGIEYETVPRQKFKDDIYTLLKAGADVVLATHPHVLQPIEFVTIVDDDGTERSCFVAYSLGNFISSQRTPPRDYGVIANLGFSKENNSKVILDSVDLYPVWVKFTSATGVYDITVLPVNELDKPEFASIFADLSADDYKRIQDIVLEFNEMLAKQSKAL